MRVNFTRAEVTGTVSSICRMAVGTRASGRMEDIREKALSSLVTEFVMLANGWQASITAKEHFTGQTVRSIEVSGGFVRKMDTALLREKMAFITRANG